MTADGETAARAAVERLNHRLLSKDAGNGDEFEDDALLVGSETGERAERRKAIALLFAGLMAKPRTVRWAWDRLDVATEGDVAWIFADGNALPGEDGGECVVPYRLSGVRRRRGDTWRWRLFHRPEPAAG